MAKSSTAYSRSAFPSGTKAWRKGNARGPRTSPAGRRCAEEECGVVLSRYNHGEYCSPHERVRPFDSRRGRPPG